MEGTTMKNERLYDYTSAYIEYDPKTETCDIWVTVVGEDEEDCVASFLNIKFAKTILDEILEGKHEL
jgi:hypothetical protein